MATTTKPRKIRLSFIGIAEDPAIVKLYFPSGTFTKTSTGGSVRIEGEGVTLIWSNRYVGIGLLKIIGQTKAHVRKRFHDGKIADVRHIPKYSAVGPVERMARAVELDLSSAYLSAAYKIGAIDSASHSRLSRISKSSRLMALGSLATKGTVQEFVGWKKVSTAIKYDKETGEVWRRIVAEVDLTMKKLAEESGKEFLYYWCDAIFVRPGAAEQVERRAALLGYRMKKKAVIMGVFGKMRRYIGVDDGRKFSIDMRVAT